MTYEEAKESLEEVYEDLQKYYGGQSYADIRDFFLDGVAFGIEAVEKQIPKETIETEDFIRGCCPSCKRYVDDDYVTEDFKYCQYCGQAIHRDNKL